MSNNTFLHINTKKKKRLEHCEELVSTLLSFINNNQVELLPLTVFE